VAGTALPQRHTHLQHIHITGHQLPHLDNLPLHRAYPQNRTTVRVQRLSHVGHGALASLLPLVEAVLLEFPGLAGYCVVRECLPSVWSRLYGVLLRGGTEALERGAEDCAASHVQGLAGLFEGEPDRGLQA